MNHDSNAMFSKLTTNALDSVSERIVEQVVDVPRGDPVAQDPQHERLPTRAAAVWLDAPQGQFESFFFFHTFPRPPKSAKVASQSTAELGAHSSSFTSSVSLCQDHLG